MKIKNLLLAIPVFTAILAVSSCFASPVFAKTLNFAVASDVHYTQKGNDNAQKALNGFVTRMNENNYDFVIFLGDNIDKSKQENLESFLSVTKKIKSPYYFVLGDKDAHKISGIEKKDYLAQAAKTNRRQPKDKSSYYFQPDSQIMVVVLDNVSSGMPTTHGVFTQQTLLWLDEILTKNANKKVIIFQHVPYIQPYEKESHELLSPNDFRAVLSRHDNIISVISGHYHKEYSIKDAHKVTHINAPALYLEPYNYLEIKVDYDKPFLGKAKNFQITKVAKPAI